MYRSKYLPKVPNYGYLNPDFTLPIRSVQPDPVELHDTDWLDQAVRAYPKIEMPDIVKVHWGRGDPDTVGRMYAQLEGKDAGLIGVSDEMIQKYLTDWGYPINPRDWTAEQFDAAIASHAMDVNPLAPQMMTGAM